ncbi:M56 family peptidase [Glaciihabitans arcticus]|uniref:M56 family peptidase n=1 Tax=Glaciihabitans arcticus TaxID=2668039 RepID=A0A4Q9GU43_9MICO|nr:M56 family metallopeptidase [Glaciihabitans arcticus]TBN58251.1 M56 family peptidase [Glaciihabitans arcticus]
MTAASLALAALALLLAWPVPILLGRARWASRSPAVALILWQAIALAGGLSMIGALLTFGLAPFGADLVSATINLLGGFEPSAGTWHLIALGAALLLATHLVLNLVVTVTRSELQRRRHASLVQLLSSPMADDPNSRLLDTPAPVAYCLPGALGSVTVFSAGLVDLLEEDELRAVIEHEKAHVAQRHDVVLVVFRAWHTSLPWFPIAYRAQREVGLLIEMLADDRARRTVADPVLARAIALVGSGAGDATAPGNPAEGFSPHDVRSRVLRIATAKPLPTAVEALIVGASAALIAVPTVLLLAPALAALVG